VVCALFPGWLHKWVVDGRMKSKRNGAENDIYKERKNHKNLPEDQRGKRGDGGKAGNTKRGAEEKGKRGKKEGV